MDVDLSTYDQIWFQLCCLSRILVGVCYVLLVDAQYYSHEFLPSFQGKLVARNTCDEYVVMGDLNARFGASARKLSLQIGLPNGV